MNRSSNELRPDAAGHSWQVSDHHDGQRVDNFLIRECKGVPRQLIYRLLRTGKVRLNNAKVRQSDRLTAGDSLQMPPVRLAERQPVKPHLHSLPPVAYEDEYYVVFDKPSGVAVHGGSGISFGLIEAVRHMRNADNLELGHRLDRDTSGLVVIAKTMPALRWFHAQLSAGQLRKDYAAVVIGHWRKQFANIDMPLRKITADRGGRRAVVAAEGLPSRTRTKCLRQSSAGALLSLRLETGRTHQARAHLAHVGLPILGDARYGWWNANRDAQKASFARMFLHAHKLAFTPYQGKARLELESQLPTQFTDALEWLDGKYVDSWVDGAHLSGQS